MQRGKLNFIELGLPLIFLLLSACARHPVTFPDLQISTDFDAFPVATDGFLIQAALKNGNASTLRIYIEGDGRAYVTKKRPSFNPTPRNPVALYLAMEDPSVSVGYLARPCQFLQGDNCADDQYWTNARYSPAVVSAMDQAVSQLKAHAGAQFVDLVGYSGGGSIALLVAARRTDVLQVTTVAGNIDLDAWVADHRYSPLLGSLNPKFSIDRLKGVPRLHFVGESDTVVKPEIAFSYEAAASDNAGKVVVVEGQGHSCCWIEVWKKLINQYGLVQ